MRIIDDKRYMQADIDAAVRIDGGGWNTEDDRNNYYEAELLYNPACGLVILKTSGSWPSWSRTEYFSSPDAFADYCVSCDRNWAKLLGDIDESNATAMAFVDAILGEDAAHD